MFNKRELQYEGYEAHINGEFHVGIILEIKEDAIKVRPFDIDYDRPVYPDRHDAYWIAKEDFDKVKLELWEDHWGCDNSAIGLSGYFKPWKDIWGEGDQLQFSC